MNTWIKIPQESDFTIHNLPFGIFSTPERSPRMGVAIGGQILDLAGIAEQGLFDALEVGRNIFNCDTLNEFIGLGKNKTNAVRLLLQSELANDQSILREHSQIFIDQKNTTMHLPVQIGDYTDFYSSIEHATNVGKMFRDPENALFPNWRHLPVGYHGRASSIVLSGYPVRRPNGQIKPPEGPPVYGPSTRLDFELEMAFIVGKTTAVSQVVDVDIAEDYIFGIVLFNDWSARDIQKWEYVPLGPFLGKSFASSISPWVVSLEALEPYRIQGPEQFPEVLPYLKTYGKRNIDINLSVSIQPENEDETVVCHSNSKYLYWNIAQQLAHHTSNGCNIRIGDIMASGTISGKDPQTFGSMLELSWAGKNPVHLNDGTERVFLEDYDTVTMRGYAGSGEERVGFGEVSNQILPAF